jgi:manganese/zinc/iron transport system permease protein
MLSEFLNILQTWGPLDTWIVVTAALAAMACALPGNFLVLRRQSMMGDALSHTVLLGLVVAFLVTHRLLTAGWISNDAYNASQNTTMFAGAMLFGVLSAVLTEWIHKLGRVEASAALGVVFTTLFALALLLIRVAADGVHIDADCVLYGEVETIVMRTDAVNLPLVGSVDLPQAAVINGGVLLANGFLILLFFKELRISTFDPALATALGIPAQLMHYALMAVTAATLVAAFESVGSILVIAMLIVPAATASLLTDRLAVMIGLSLLVAASSAVLGHVLALTLPPIVLVRLGFETLTDVSASTAGMMAASSGLLFLTALLFAPRHGVFSKIVHQSRLSLRIAGEDILGFLYRSEETQSNSPTQTSPHSVPRVLGIGPILTRLALYRLMAGGQVVRDGAGYRLTASGRTAAETLVRSHRLWESYMARHFTVPDDHLHETAARVEHYLDPALRQELSAELNRPSQDPHGRTIPPEGQGERGCESLDKP